MWQRLEQGNEILKYWYGSMSLALQVFHQRVKTCIGVGACHGVTEAEVSPSYQEWPNRVLGGIG
ncbi:hypothetical protein CBM2638_U90005 [Cupriavidus taiwanensis]|uniref:Uncharacterized protein n=1 Tax=Cupriavidus taiwanensis TaxID=164546 RepID=A0A375HDU2_9BURK|nr:hypothetical protein CBM2638_U90005 [Cupriavidus taiwanensis]SPD49038.1 protein of unknown function [Cupriavidus taiwanensis]